MSLEAQLLAEIATPAMKQKDVAQTYAMAINSALSVTDWRKVNDAIRVRWPKGLVRVKKMAWKMLDVEGVNGKAD